MNETFKQYEDARKAIYEKNYRKNTPEDPDDLMDPFARESSTRIDARDLLEIGSRMAIGGGLGFLSGIAAVAVAIHAAEIVVTGTVAKVAGLVGGAMGLSSGLKRMDKNVFQEEFPD